MTHRLFDAEAFSVMMIILLFGSISGLKQLRHCIPVRHVSRMTSFNVEVGLCHTSYRGCKQYDNRRDDNDAVRFDYHRNRRINLIPCNHLHDPDYKRKQKRNVMKLYSTKNNLNTYNTTNRNILKDGHLYLPQGVSPTKYLKLSISCTGYCFFLPWLKTEINLLKKISNNHCHYKHHYHHHHHYGHSHHHCYHHCHHDHYRYHHHHPPSLCLYFFSLSLFFFLLLYFPLNSRFSPMVRNFE